jgi:cardiolipin synthase A/B
MRSVIFTAQNRLTILQNGAEYFPALMQAIDAARIEIYFETYIFARDEIGLAVREALKRASARGVVVHVITDWLGTGRKFGAKLEHNLKDAGVEHRSFNPWFRRGIARSHRKICVVDGAIAFVGGININDDFRYDYDHKQLLPAPRWDFAVRIEGPLVAHIHHETEAQWVRVGKLSLISRIELMREMRSIPDRVVGKPGLAGFVVRDNLHNRRTIQRSYMRALGVARKSVFLVNPYFAPGRKLRNAIARATERGVEVTIVLGVGEFWMQDWVAQSFYPKLLKEGVKVYEYRKTQLHAKVAVIDDVWSTVGSSNVDGISLFINQEANVVVRDATFAKTLRAHIAEGIAESTQILLEDFAIRPWYKRAWYGFAFMLYRGMMRVVTLGDYT